MATPNSEDEVSNKIDELYAQIIVLRFQYMDLKKENIRNLPDEVKQARLKEMEERELVLIEIQKNFDQIIRTHTLYCTYKKKTGKTSSPMLKETFKKLSDIQSGLPSIVQIVPSK